MRRKTETRREAILSHALEVFRKEGFEGASMSQIAAQVGGSKATLYNYFASKEELLLEAMLDSARQHAGAIRELLDDNGDFSHQLSQFVASLLCIIQSAHTVEVLRVAIAVGAKTDVGKQFFEKGTHEVWEAIALRMQREIERGHLRDDDPQQMAAFLRCLCEGELIRNLLGAGTGDNDDTLAARTRWIVGMFLRAFGVHGQPGH